MKLKLLHTSDWHIGKTLYTKKRYEEFAAFLSWLVEIIRNEQINALIIAGDIFDTSTPSNRAQELYYSFLCRVASLAPSCRHIIVIAGNHDSPSFLNAPKELLRVLNVHVIGAITENHEDEVLLLKNKKHEPELIVCAIPYLRDRDIRTAEVNESIIDKDRKLLDGVQAHYLSVCGLAEQKRKELDTEIPIVVTGHLFTQGGKTIDGDGVRELYIGSLAHVSANIFPNFIDYLALGHLHSPQKINNSDIMLYSGSPLSMSFAEAKQEKSICLVEFINNKTTTLLINVPIFQELELIRGTWDKISARILELSVMQSRAWLEIVYEGEEVIGDLRERLDAAVSGTKIEILRIKNNRITACALNKNYADDTLNDLDMNEVFVRCLDAHDVPKEQRPALLHAYQETISIIYEEDVHAE